MEKEKYEDHELEEFRDIIIAKKITAEKELKFLKSHVHDENEVADISIIKDMREHHSEIFTKEELHALASRQIKFISSLDKALMRIENKTYGICRVTGKKIPPERLKLVPHATLTVEAKRMENSPNPGK